MSESKIENELLEAAGALFKTKKHETRPEYLHRLCNVIAKKISNEAWEALSQEAQDWNNDTAEALTNGKEAIDFPDLAAADPVDEEVDEEAEEVVAKPKANTKQQKEQAAPKEKEKVVAKPDKAKTSVAPQGTRKVSACHTIKKLVVKNPKISVSELSEQLKEDGLKVSDVTIATLRSDLRDTLRVLNELEIAKFVL
jgi:outer membrane biosynthesis protein TonB